jgi:hypothetical protein
MMVAPQPSREGKNAMQDSERREQIKQLDQLSEQIKEREHEETRQEIDELFRRVRAPGQNNGAWTALT